MLTTIQLLLKVAGGACMQLRLAPIGCFVCLGMSFSGSTAMPVVGSTCMRSPSGLAGMGMLQQFSDGRLCQGSGQLEATVQPLGLTTPSAEPPSDLFPLAKKGSLSKETMPPELDMLSLTHQLQLYIDAGDG